MDETSRTFKGQTFTDADLKAIPNLEKIELLALWDTAVTDDGLIEILRAQSLIEVSIDSEILSDSALQLLAQLPSLRSLQIHYGPKMSDHGVRYLSNCVGLRELYLKNTEVSDDGLRYIGELPQVWSLILDGTSISDRGCEALMGMQKLSLLGLEDTRVKGSGLACLPDNEYFHVYLDGASATDAGVMALARHLSNLKLISLCDTDVGNEAAKELAKLKRLNDVRLSNTKLTDEGLAAFGRHPYLDVIYVRGCRVSSQTVASLKATSPRKLTVYGPEQRS